MAKSTGGGGNGGRSGGGGKGGRTNEGTSGPFSDIAEVVKVTYTEKVTKRGGYEGAQGYMPQKYTTTEERTAYLFKTKGGQYSPIKSASPDNYLFVARNFPDQASPPRPAMSYKDALKEATFGKKNIVIKGEKSSKF